MIEIIGRYSPRQEVYSIDEVIWGITEELTTYGQKIRETALRETGIPMCEHRHHQDPGVIQNYVVCR